MLKTLEKNLNLHKIDYKYFDTSDEVKEYLRNELNGEKIAFGGSMTLKELGIYDILRENNEVFWHWETKTPEQRKIESELTVYMLSANAIAAPPSTNVPSKVQPSITRLCTPFVGLLTLSPVIMFA